MSKDSVVTIRHASSRDCEALEPILKVWLKDRDTGEDIPEEVSGVLAKIKESVSTDTGAYYIVAEIDNEVIGVMGFQSASGPMLPHTLTDNPAELINAYVHPEKRKGSGVGRSLLLRIEEEVHHKGFKEIVINSGPRYKDTAWGFYTHMYGEPVGIIKELYGKGGDALVWRKVL